ncbi:MAG: ATP-binding cassette domain-containing protein, partial [Firmicutes bacterium]|nr:ATP-binding cassette domain-containing protein [Bacillota bacterium]
MSLEVDIRKKLHGFELDVSFNTAGCSRLGVLGHSGSGKSMTLKSIAGIVTPDEGRIVLNDRVLFDSRKKINLPPQKRKVGYLFQSYALFPHMRIIDNIACGLQLSKKEARQNGQIKQIVEMLHLDGLEERYPGQLSGGQQQRAALARILAFHPEIILLDEPFSALDEPLRAELQRQLAGILHSWQKEAILVTHSHAELRKLSDR